MTDHGWRKSSFSGSQANCVEVGGSALGILVRDTTDRDGFTMPVTRRAWRDLLSRVRNDDSVR